jgi:murein DD-endopeptidase MepM/ murein hydrolase activator NlpD
MSLEAAVGRIGQILTWEQQMADPAMALSGPAASGSLPGADAAGGASADAGSSSFAQTLAQAQSATGGVAPTPNASGYVNPLANAQVRPERIDQGVDYSGSGTLGALGPGVVTKVVQSGSGWEGGGFVEYKLTAGPYAGRYVFYAEGVSPTVSVGQTLTAGQPVATIIPGSAHGIEIGWGSGQGESAYASASGGGYSEGQMTAAGKAFSDLIASLGGPAGLAEGRQLTGTFS